MGVVQVSTGFFGGLVAGAAGTVFKPLSKIGQAAQDIGLGISAEVSTEGKLVGNATQRKLYSRRRLPRLL
jgi:hypothetical protein